MWVVMPVVLVKQPGIFPHACVRTSLNQQFVHWLTEDDRHFCQNMSYKLKSYVSLKLMETIQYHS